MVAPTSGRRQNLRTSEEQFQLNFRFLAARQVGRKRDEKFQNPPRNATVVKKEKAESLDFPELLNTYRMRSRGGASRRGLIKKKIKIKKIKMAVKDKSLLPLMRVRGEQ